jgi:D-beta-D-heptose 7-phosphate kinase/D-beta-D-heptose 1-phosphate adenosyltransferase
VPVVTVERAWSRAGGAAGVAASLAALGSRVGVIGLTGTDADGAALRHVLAEAGVAEGGIAVRRELTTNSAIRVVDDDHRLLFRIDRDGDMDAFARAAPDLMGRIPPRVPEHQVIVMYDHGKGALPDEQVRSLIAACRERAIPCVAATRRSDLAPFRGATTLTFGMMDADPAFGRLLRDPRTVGGAASEARTRLDVDHLLVDRGTDGMILARDRGTEPVMAPESGDPRDMVAAILATCLALGWDIPEACRLASNAAKHAASPSAQETATEDDSPGRSRKILDHESARRWVADRRRRGRRVVFTNGCFDILHAGHLASLEEARGFGDILVVGLNSDASVRINKGPSRPINRQEHRAALLAGLSCVDAVVLFDEETPEDLIRRIEPDVLVKGGDYDALTIAGSEFVRGRGGEVRIIPLVEGLSTTRILSAYLREP